MKIAETILPGVYVIEPHVHADARGFLLETWHATRYAQARLPAQFVQSNHSRSIRGTLRGLHYQLTHPQGKLVWVVQGRVFDVAVDLRVGSPTFGRWISESLSEDNHRQLYVPPGVAHGFCTVSEHADVLYHCTECYVPEDEHGVRWNDPQLAIPWPLTEPLLSEKDRAYPLLDAIPPEHLPRVRVER